jgi:ABC-type transporter lipoprotein component MlaA
MFKKGVIIFALILCLISSNFIVLAQETKYPDYSYEFLGEDKWENFNRKMFNFNLGLNKYAIRPIHILWSSIMPEYGMDRLQGVANNIEFPIRLVSSLIQRDFKTSKNETIRFFTNSILGLGGMYDPAKHIFHIVQAKEDMEQALAGCKIQSGQYFVLPVLSFTNFRGILGKILDMALNPSCYIGTPLLAIIKAGLTINKTSYAQTFIKLVESTYADPYEIAKKIYGIDGFIKCQNLDRTDISKNLFVKNEDEKLTKDTSVSEVVKNKDNFKTEESKSFVKMEVTSEILLPDLLYGGAIFEDETTNNTAEDFKLSPDIVLKNYNPQNPVVDSMRTALFQVSGVDKSIWNELSIWNRSFSKQIKTSSVNITEGKEDYNFRYILQKKCKKSPVAIIYPSIGEGINSGHSVLLAKLFYDAGYSVIIQGSHFQWEFVKSMPDKYYPGLPDTDAQNLRLVTSKILEKLSQKYGYEFDDKVIIGTSFGALAALFVGEKEYENSTLGNLKIISICPPVDLIYAMKQVDKNSQEWNKSPEDLKQKVALTAAKIVNLYNFKSENIDFEINNLPFSEEEGKLITGFIMHQKLSDLIFTIENASKSKKSDIYYVLNNMGYQDYAQKYLLSDNLQTCDDLTYEASLYSIENYLTHSHNYKIYHSLNDYLTNPFQLKQLKKSAGDNIVFLDNGAHLGFMYRKEFIEDLKNTISLK